MKNSKILEAFGDPIGSYAGDAPTGAPMEMLDAGDCCSSCSMMPTDVEGGGCGCEASEGKSCSECGMAEGDCTCQQSQQSDVCPNCGMMSMEPGMPCECMMSEGKKKAKGPQKRQPLKF